MWSKTTRLIKMYEINSTYKNNDSGTSSGMDINSFFGKDYDPETGYSFQEDMGNIFNLLYWELSFCKVDITKSWNDFSWKGSLGDSSPSAQRDRPTCARQYLHPVNLFYILFLISDAKLISSPLKICKVSKALIWRNPRLARNVWSLSPTLRHPSLCWALSRKLSGLQLSLPLINWSLFLNCHSFLNFGWQRLQRRRSRTRQALWITRGFLILSLTIFLLILVTPHSNVAALQVFGSLTFTTTHYWPKYNINTKRCSFMEGNPA